MPFGCFGKRRKHEKTDDLAAKNPTAADTPDDGEAGRNDAKTHSAPSDGTKLADLNGQQGVSEVVTVARAHSLHASAPNSVEHRHTTIGIQKSATLARYDFLRKSEYANTADRWSALRQQYLSPTMSSSQSQHHNQQPQLRQHSGAALNGSAGGARRTAQSLPRQFAPPGPAGPVRFSQWFYERQTKETNARREFLEREEKNRKLIEGVEEAPAASIPEEASVPAETRDRPASPEPQETKPEGSSRADKSEVVTTETKENSEPAEPADSQDEKTDEDQQHGDSDDSPASVSEDQPVATNETTNGVSPQLQETESDNKDANQDEELPVPTTATKIQTVAESD